MKAVQIQFNQKKIEETYLLEYMTFYVKYTFPPKG